MIFRVPFGDPSGDGHGETVEVWVSTPNAQFTKDALKSIRRQWGNDFFEGFAQDYMEPYLSPTVWEALEESDYPFEKVFDLCETAQYIWTDIRKFSDFKYSDFEISIEGVIDMYLHLLNYHGAQLTKIDKPFEDLPIETVGYGCFE